MHVRTSGTDFKANGNITVENVGNTEVYCKITAGNGSSLHGHYCVPAKDEAGETMFAGYLISWSASLSNSGNRTNGRIILACSCDIEAQVVTPGIYQFFDIMTADSGGYHRQFDLPLKLPVQTDIKLIAEKIGGTGVVDAAGSFNLWFEG